MTIQHERKNSSNIPVNLTSLSHRITLNLRLLLLLILYPLMLWARRARKLANMTTNNTFMR